MHRIILRLLVHGCVAASIAAVPALADSISLAPSKDNSLYQVVAVNPALPSHGQLSNGLGDVFVGRTNQDGQGPATISIRRGLLAFVIAGSIPAGAIVTSASLTMRDVMGLNGDRSVELRRTSADWGEGTTFFNGGQGAPASEGDVTWFYRFFNAANPTASPAWTNPGGDFSLTASASSVVSDDLGVGQLFTWSSVGNPLMLADVQNWLDNPAANFGWTMVGVETAGQTAKRFNSGESTASPNVPPVLTIEYTLIPEPGSLALAAVAITAWIGTSRSRRCSAAL